VGKRRIDVARVLYRKQTRHSEEQTMLLAQAKARKHDHHGGGGGDVMVALEAGRWRRGAIHNAAGG